jgi:hypothetical protein
MNEDNSLPTVPGRIDRYLEELDGLPILKDANTQGSIRWYIQWYERRFPSRRLYYRGAGIIVIVAILTMSLCATVRGTSTWSPLLLPGTVAIVALNGFFGWKAAWRGYFLAKVRLEVALQAFEAARCQARYVTSNEAEMIALIKVAFDRLLEEFAAAVTEETKGFFDASRFPNPLRRTQT